MKELAKYEPLSMPLRTIPPNQLDMQVIDVLGVIQKLLSITSNSKNDSQLPVLAAMVKDAAWSKSPKQIIEAFTLYVKCKLSLNGKMLEPISGHLDAIVFGKVMQAYTDQLPPLTPKVSNKEISEGDKEEIMKAGVKRCHNEFKEEGKVSAGNSHIFDYLEDNKEITVSNERKKEIMVLASQNLKRSSSILEKYVRSESRIVSEAKRILLDEYFKNKKGHSNTNN